MATSFPLAVYALTRRGALLGSGLAAELGAALHVPSRLAAEHPAAEAFDSLAVHIHEGFARYRGHVFIAAAGIVVRIIAPLLKGKDRDPAVVVLDQEGRHAISLLSGHLGGGNDLARRVAAITRGAAIITTATDCAGTPAMDLLALESDLAIGNLPALRRVNLMLAEGDTIFVYDPEGNLYLPPETQKNIKTATSPKRAHVIVTHSSGQGEGKLLLHPRCLCVGVGCRRGVPAPVIIEALARALDRANLSIAGVRAMASVQAKASEQGLLDAARSLNIPLRFFPATELDAVPVPNPSEKAALAVGTASVCEAAAMLLAESNELLVEKTIHQGVTIAVSRRSTI